MPIPDRAAVVASLLFGGMRLRHGPEHHRSVERSKAGSTVDVHGCDTGQERHAIGGPRPAHDHPGAKQPRSSVQEPQADDSTDATEACQGPSRPEVTGTVDPTKGKPQVGLLVLVAAFVLLVDVVTKAIIVTIMHDGESVRMLGGLVYFSLYRNPGMAFSMATGMTWILAVVAIGVVVLIATMARKLRSPLWAVCLGLILGGALGNLTDRIFRSPGVLHGHVVDFISVFGPDAKYFAIFNLAAAAISTGAVMLVVATLTGIDFDGRRVGRGKRSVARTLCGDGLAPPQG